MNIVDLEKTQKPVTVKGTIVEISEIKTFPRFGEPGRLQIAVLKDQSGKIELSLWDEETDSFEKGDEIVVENGKVKSFKGNLQLSTGKSGKIEKL